MQVEQFLDSKISLDKLSDLRAEIFKPGEYFDDVTEYLGDGITVAEISLHNFNSNASMARSGRNAFSVLLYLKEDKIVWISRVGHCHMCGGQGSDDTILRFPKASLEKEATEILDSLLVTPPRTPKERKN